MNGLLENLGSDRHYPAQLTACFNVFVERLWKTIKYKEVYLHADPSVSTAEAGIGRHLDFYNGRRPHTRLATKPQTRHT